MKNIKFILFPLFAAIIVITAIVLIVYLKLGFIFNIIQWGYNDISDYC